MKDKYISNLEIRNSLFQHYQIKEDTAFWDRIATIAPQTELLSKLFQYEDKIDQLIKKKFYDY